MYDVIDVQGGVECFGVIHRFPIGPRHLSHACLKSGLAAPWKLREIASSRTSGRGL